MIKINVINLNRRRKIDTRNIKSIAKKTLKNSPPKAEKLKTIIQNLNIIIITDNYIKKLNKRYKHKNVPTDVLCFSMPEEADVFISSDRAAVNSKRFGTSFKSEIYLYVIHGILHMLGYSDDAKYGRIKMERMQESILKEL